MKKANNLVLELSADLEEEEQPSQKKKPTTVENTRKKAERRKRSRKASPSFMDTLEDEVEDEVQAKRTRFVSRPMSKYEQLREKRIAERKQIIWGSLTCFDLIMTSLHIKSN